MIGLRKGTVRLCAYNSEWSDLYEQEASRLRSLLGENVLSIEHIGSTAISGMMSKPIIDVMVAVPTMEVGQQVVSTLISNNYIRRPNGDLEDRIFLVKGEETLRTHHISLTELQSNYWHQHILFRDCMRKNPDLANRYIEIKSVLSVKYKNDRAKYTEGKEDFVKDVLRREF